MSVFFTRCNLKGLLAASVLLSASAVWAGEWVSYPWDSAPEKVPALMRDLIGRYGSQPLRSVEENCRGQALGLAGKVLGEFRKGISFWVQEKVRDAQGNPVYRIGFVESRRRFSEEIGRPLAEALSSPSSSNLSDDCREALDLARGLITDVESTIDPQPPEAHASSLRSQALQHETDRLAQNFEISVTELFEAACPASYVNAAKSQLFSKGHGDSPLGNGSLSDPTRDLSRVDRALGEFTQVFPPSPQKACEQYRQRAEEDLAQLKNHLEKEKAASSGDLNAQVYVQQLEKRYQNTSDEDCESWVVDSSSSMSKAFYLKQGRTSRMDYLKGSLLNYLDQHKMNPRHRVSLTLLGREGMRPDLSSCYQVGTPIAADRYSRNGAVLRQNIAQLKPSDSTPLTLGLLEGIRQNVGCRGTPRIALFTDGGKENSDNCAQALCAGVARLAKKGIHLKFTFFRTNSRRYRSQSDDPLGEELDCLKHYADEVTYGNISSLGTDIQLYKTQTDAHMQTPAPREETGVAGKLQGSSPRSVLSGELSTRNHRGDVVNFRVRDNGTVVRPEAFLGERQTDSLLVANESKTLERLSTPDRGSSSAASSGDPLNTLENKYYSHDYSRETPERRLNRLESLVFGEPRPEASIQERMERLRSLADDSAPENFSSNFEHSEGGSRALASADSAPLEGLKREPLSLPMKPQNSLPEESLETRVHSAVQSGIYKGHVKDHPDQSCTVVVRKKVQVAGKSESLVDISVWRDSEVHFKNGSSQLSGTPLNFSLGQSGDFALGGFAATVGELRTKRHLPVTVLGKGSSFVPAREQNPGHLVLQGMQPYLAFQKEVTGGLPVRRTIRKDGALVRPVKDGDALALTKKEFSADIDLGPGNILTAVRAKMSLAPFSASELRNQDARAWKQRLDAQHFSHQAPSQQLACVGLRLYQGTRSSASVPDRVHEGSKTSKPTH